MAIQTVIAASAGDDLFRIAASYYGDAAGWVLIARANSLFDPIIATDTNLSIPNYSKIKTNDGIMATT